MELNRKLLDTQKSEKLKNEGGQRFKITPDALFQRAQSISSNRNVMVRHLGLIQITQAVVQCLEEDTSQHDLIYSLQQHFLQSLIHNPHTTFDNLMSILHNLESKGLTLPSFLIILVFVSALRQDIFNAQQLQILEARLVEKLCSSKLPSYLADSVSDPANPALWRPFMFSFLSQLFSLNKVRQSYQEYRNLIFQESDMIPATLEPLLVRVLQNILNGTQIESSNLVYQTSSLTDILMSNFRMFAKQPTPRDNSNIVLLVVGGVTASEVFQINQLAKKHPNFKIDVMATSLVKSSDTVKLLCENLCK